MMPHEKFKNLTDGIHNIVIIVAIVVGSGWTLYTFWSLGTRQRAQNELFKQAVVDISIECKQQRIEQGNEDYIQANVKIVNQGKRNTLLDFRDSPLKVDKLRFAPDGSSETELQIRQQMDSESIVLRSGATQGYSFVVKVPEEGFYVVTFEVPLDSVEMKEHIEAKGPQGKIFWSGSASIYVE